MSSVFSNLAPPPPISMFSSQPQNQNAQQSAFGGQTQNQNAQQSVFGGQTQNQASGPSIFVTGASTAAPAASSLFATSANNNNTNLGNPNPTMGNLFSNNNNANTITNNPAGSLFQPLAVQSQPQNSFTNPTLHHQAAILQAGLGSSSYGGLGQTSQQELARSRLLQANIDARPNEKSVPAQLQTLIRKWDPNSEDTLLQTYLYNAVNAAYAPFYYRNADENEKEWEEALSKKPANVESKDGENVSFVPILVRGFRALGARAEYQAKTVNEMRQRLHEMNDSLTAVMAKHQQSLTVRLETARRQHTALSQRCLRLAVKVQVLRNRGYALDGAEEGLRKALASLADHVMDPSFAAREEEIWARMVALRERTRWLEEEGKRLGQQAEEQTRSQGVPEHVMQTTKKILRDYDGQLTHLSKELEEVKKEFEEWHAGQKARQ